MKKIPFFSEWATMWNLSLTHAVVITIIILFQVEVSQGSELSKQVAKDNDEDVSIIFQIPEISIKSGVIRVGKSGNDILFFLYVKPFSVVPPDQYNQSIAEMTEQKDLRTIVIKFKKMKQDYAGTYLCYEGASDKVIDDCGVMIIVLAKPDKPVIKVSDDSSLLVGQSVRLECLFKSNSVPSNHGLNPYIVWKDADGKVIGSHSDSVKNGVLANGALIVSSLSRSDKGLIYTCLSADDPVENRDKLFSDPSDPFIVIPEYAPTGGDIKVSPDFENNTVITAMESSSLKYTCSVYCEPSCDVTWKQMSSGTNSFSPVKRAVDPSILNLEGIERSMQGSFLCEGGNKHGNVTKVFILEVQYILTPKIVVSGMGSRVKSVFEGEQEEVKLTCVIDANPVPTVVWKNPENWLINQSTISGPDIKLSNTSLLIHQYTSKVTLKAMTCEEGGTYSCMATNSLKIPRTGKVDIDVKCRPSAVKEGQYSKLTDKDLFLKSEYVWEISDHLTGKFVVRGWPSPKVKRIMSSLNGITQEESQLEDIIVSTQHPYKEERYLTLFMFQTRRDLTLDDRGRVYTFVVENSDFESLFKFAIQPRGPPLPVSMLNMTEISHNAVTLAWTPQFNGGETQTFSIYLRQLSKNQQTIVHGEKEAEWILVTIGINDELRRMEVEVKSLKAKTTYEMRVMSINSQGNATNQLTITTKKAPAASASAGETVGIVFAVFIIIIIIGGVLFYIFIYRKRWGKDGDQESRLLMIGRLSKIFKRDPNGNDGSKSKSRKFRRPIFTGKTPKPKDKDYTNVATESIDPTECEYSNADSFPQSTSTDKMLATPYGNGDSIPTDQEPFYGNIQSPYTGKGDGHIVTDEGLTYVKIDFAGTPPCKPKRSLKPADKEETDPDANPYMAIDFDKTKEKEAELKKLEEEEEKERMRKKNQDYEDEDPYENLSTTTPSMGTAV